MPDLFRNIIENIIPYTIYIIFMFFVVKTAIQIISTKSEKEKRMEDLGIDILDEEK